jgi:hypothetical protein
MSRTYTPTYRIEASYVDFTSRSKKIASFPINGKPSLKALIWWRKEMNRSFSGTNNHLAKIQSGYSHCQIVNQKTGEVVVEYNPPMFEEV